MDTFTTANLAWRLKALATDMAGDAHQLALAIGREDGASLRRRLITIGKTLVEAEGAAQRLNAAIGNAPPADPRTVEHHNV